MLVLLWLVQLYVRSIYSLVVQLRLLTKIVNGIQWPVYIIAERLSIKEELVPAQYTSLYSVYIKLLRALVFVVAIQSELIWVFDSKHMVISSVFEISFCEHAKWKQTSKIKPVCEYCFKTCTMFELMLIKNEPDDLSCESSANFLFGTRLIPD